MTPEGDHLEQFRQEIQEFQRSARALSRTIWRLNKQIKKVIKRAYKAGLLELEERN